MFSRVVKFSFSNKRVEIKLKPPHLESNYSFTCKLGDIKSQKVKIGFNTSSKRFAQCEWITIRLLIESL